MKLTNTLFSVAVFAMLIISPATNAQVILSGTGDGGFETGTTFPLNGWTVVNAGTNKWWLAAVYHPVGARGVHVSNQATGTNNNYGKNATQVSHFYRTITFPANASAIVLTYKWKCAGETGYDFIRVSLAPASTVPVVNVQQPIGQQVGTDNVDDIGTTTHQETINLPNSLAGTTKTLIFSWINDDSGGSNPGGALDDINVTYTPLPGCTGTPNTGNITATGNITSFCGSATTTLTLNSPSTGTGISYQWQYFDGTLWQPTGTNATTLAITNLATTTQYRAVTTCANSTLSATATAVTITVNTAPTVSVSPAESFVCSSTASATLTATGTGTFTWSPATGLNTTTGPTVIATPGTSGKAYTVTATLGPCTATATAAVNVATPPTLTTTATPSSICSGASSQLATTQLTSGDYQIYNIAPYTLTPSSTTVAFSNTVAPNTGTFDDGRSAAISLPFPFSFFGTAVTQIFLGTNGLAAFANQGALADAYDAQHLPDNTTPNAVIALFWHDLTFDDNGSCTYGTYGTTPNRRFVISYTGVPALGDAAAVNTGQIILHETTNYVDIVVQSSTYGGEDKTLGIESTGTGIVGLSPTGRNLLPWTVPSGASEAYRFAPTNFTYAWSPATNLSSTSIYNPSATNLTAPVTYSVNVTNSVTGCIGTGTAPIAVNPIPTAAISGGTSPICAGQTSAVTFTGTPGATVTYNIDGGGPLTATLDAGGSYVLTTAALNANTSYNLTGVVSSQSCTGTATGTATINVNPRPTATIGGSQTICDGATGFIQINPGAGTGPWTVNYIDNNSAPYTATISGSSNIPLTPNTTTTYTITGIQDANCSAIAGDWSGTATINVNPRPTASLSLAAPAICEGDNTTLTVTMTGTPPFTVEISDGTTSTPYTGIMTNTYDIVVNPSVATTYTLSYVQDANCFGTGPDLGPDVTLNYNIRPTATISGDNTICNGDNTPITYTLTGNGPWDLDYSDGSTNTSLTGIPSPSGTFSVSPSVNTIYTLVNVSDVNCTAVASGMTGSATITVNQLPAIVTPPATENRCQGDFATFSVSATGTGIGYQWMENGSPLTDGVVYSGTNTQTLTISDLTGLDGNTYSVEVSGTCLPAVTSSPATLNVNTTNTWTGTTSTLWSDVTNWGCGILPNVNTNVVIPTPVPNMPEVDIPTAICNSISVDAGASVTFIGTGNALEVKSDISGLGTFDASAGRVILSGTALQNIPGVTYGGLDVEGGSNKNFSGNATVTGILNLVDGYITLGANDLTLTQTATVTNSSAQSFVITDGSGVVIGQDMGTGANTGSVLFPVGSNTASYTPITIANAGALDNINVRVIDGVWDTYNIETPNGTQQIENAVNKTWFINEDIVGGSDATVTPQWNVLDELPSFNNGHCEVSHYNTLTNEWEDSPMTAAAGSGPYTQTRTGVLSFSPFGVGSDNSPLPLDLVSFKGELVNDDVRLNWQTANEFNMENFQVERSIDKGKKFELLSVLPAGGNNKGGFNNYQDIDESIRNLKADKILYRLKIKEKNGKYKYSDVVTINISSKIARGMIDAYPNPVTGSTVFIRMAGDNKEAVSIAVTDMSGKVLSTVTYKAGEYKADAVAVDITGIAQGMYMLKVVGADNKLIDVIKFNRL